MLHALRLSGTIVGATLALSAVPDRVVTATAESFKQLTLPTILARAGAQVEEFFARAQSLVCTEIVRLQPLTSGFSPEGLGRTVESELRLSWEPGLGGPATEALTERKVIEVNGHPPRENDPNNCTTPEQQETETQPLSMLLPQQREKYEFELVGEERVDDRDAIVIKFRELAPVAVDVSLVEGKEDCISYDLTGGERGRIWIDRETADVLRLDQHLTGMIDLRLPREVTRRPGSPLHMTLERADTSIRFGRVTFKNPDESIILPVSSSSLRIMRGSGAPRLRTFIKYTDYKRFLTGGRIVGE